MITFLLTLVKTGCCIVTATARGKRLASSMFDNVFEFIFRSELRVDRKLKVSLLMCIGMPETSVEY